MGSRMRGMQPSMMMLVGVLIDYVKAYLVMAWDATSRRFSPIYLALLVTHVPLVACDSRDKKQAKSKLLHSISHHQTKNKNPCPLDSVSFRTSAFPSICLVLPHHAWWSSSQFFSRSYLLPLTPPLCRCWPPVTGITLPLPSSMAVAFTWRLLNVGRVMAAVQRSVFWAALFAVVSARNGCLCVYCT